MVAFVVFLLFARVPAAHSGDPNAMWISIPRKVCKL